MCKRAGLLVGWDATKKRALIVPASCDSWDCPECALKMRERWQLRAAIGAREIINSGERCDFVTITSHEKLRDFASTVSVWRSAWPVLYSAVKRKKHDLKYMIIPEKHKDGRMHVHVMWNAGVSQRWLKDAARSRGLGYQAKVINMKEAHWAVKYVTKYLAKDLGDDMPERFHRVRVSQNWPEIPTPVTEHSPLKWEYITDGRALFVILAECDDKDYDVENGKTYQPFDLDDFSWSGNT